MSLSASDTPLPPAPSRKRAGETKPRVEAIDYAKGIGILLVVAAHVWRGLATAGIAVPAALHEQGAIDRWVYGFHMPLFFFASGLFLYRSAAKPARSFVSDKLSTIAWPYLVWSVIYWQLSRFSARAVPVLSGKAFVWSLIVAPIGHLWFLSVLFLIALLALACRKLRLPAWAFLILAIGLNAAARYGGLNAIVDAAVGEAVDSPAGRVDHPTLLAGLGLVYQLAMFLPYVVAAGVVARPLFAAYDRWPTWSWVLLALLGAAGVTVAVRLDPVANSMFSAYSGWPGIMMVLAIARLLERFHVRPLQFLGVLSLEIYLVHILVASRVRADLLNHLHVSQWAIHLTVGFTAAVVAPVGLWWICKQVGFPYLFRLRSPFRQKTE